MTPHLDAGPCLSRARTPIAPEEDAVALEARLSQLGIEPVARALEMLEQWDGQAPLGEPQDASQACKAPRLKKSDGSVHWTQEAPRIARQVRALQPWPGTYAQWQRPKGPLRLILERATWAEDVSVPDDAEPGQILEAGPARLVVATGDGALAILQIRPAGKVTMSVGEFLRGYPLQPGDRLQ
jgi:methionyl-tRNA formyltransferase